MSYESYQMKSPGDGTPLPTYYSPNINSDQYVPATAVAIDTELNKGSGRNDETSRDSEEGEAIIQSKYLDLEFEACFKEHKSTRTYPKIYQVFGYVFKYTKFVTYHILVVIFGIFLAFLWAVILSIVSFVISWLWNPSLKAMLLVVGATLPAVTEPLKALFTPLVDVAARIFRQIHVKGSLDGKLLSPLAKTDSQMA